jgi:hypothetical protein
MYVILYVQADHQPQNNNVTFVYSIIRNSNVRDIICILKSTLTNGKPTS